jgi:hypothetical protein
VPPFVIEAGGLLRKTRADLVSDLQHDDGTIAFVYGDSSDPNNGIYLKSGDPGTGQWFFAFSMHVLLQLGNGLANYTNLPAGENLAAGAFVSISRAGGVATAINADCSIADRTADGFVLGDVPSGGTAAVLFGSQINNALSGLASGKKYYLSTHGTISQNLPTSPGSIVQEVGVSLSGTAILFQPSNTESTNLGLPTPQMFGAPNNGTDDDTAGMQAAIDYAFAHNISGVFLPDTGIPYNIASAGTAIVGEDTVRGIVRVRPGVSILSNGAHCILSGGRHNPPIMFFQDYVQNVSIDDFKLVGLIVDGNIDNQTWDAQTASAPADIGYQQSHGLEILKGEHILVDKCKFTSWRGDGCVWGNTNVPPPNTQICHDVKVMRCEFVDCFREGVIFAGCDVGAVWKCFFHGNGFIVGGVDIERHSSYEIVRSVTVSECTFDFTDGVAPVEIGRTGMHYRRAVAIAFFFAGYVDNANDGLSSKHLIFGNTVFQGMMDCHMHDDVTFQKNFFVNTLEDISGAAFVTNDTLSIFNDSSVTGFNGIEVIDNTIDSAMAGCGIHAYNYVGMDVHGNKVRNTELSGILMQFCASTVYANKVQDCGTTGANCSGILFDANLPSSAGTAAFGNVVLDTRSGTDRTVTYAIECINGLNVQPVFNFNQAINLNTGIVKMPVAQPDFLIAAFNTDAAATVFDFTTPNSIVSGDGDGDTFVTLEGGAADNRYFRIRDGNDQIMLLGITGASGGDGGDGTNNDVIVWTVFNDDGTFLRNIVKHTRSTGKTEFDGGGEVTFAGTYNKPVVLANGVQLWGDLANGKLYSSTGTPSNATDGNQIAMGGTYLDPVLFAGTVRFWADPATAKFYCKNGSDPSSVTDGTVIGSQT